MDLFSKILGMSAMRGLGLAQLPKLIQLGWSGNKALSWLKLKGIGYQRQVFQADWRQLLGIEKKKTALRHVNRAFYGTVNTIEMTDENLSAKYRITYEVTVKDKLTDEKYTIYKSAVSDTRLTMGQWDDLMEDILLNERYESMYEILDMQRDSLLEKRLK